MMILIGLCVIAVAVFLGLNNIAKALMHNEVGENVTQRATYEGIKEALVGKPMAKIISKEEPVEDFLKKQDGN